MSMQPTLQPGQLVLATGWFSGLRPGDVVIMRHEGIEKIKRISQVRLGEVFVVGDNQAASTDSRDFGWLSTRLVIAKVLRAPLLVSGRLQ